MHAAECAVRAVAPPAPSTSPSHAAMLALQRSAGNQAVARMLGRSRGLARADAFDLARSGPAVEVPRRREMEAAFGTDFGDVRAHLGGGAAVMGMHVLGARAAARGRDVVFREATPPADLIAHELAHVVQQRRGAAAVACRDEADAPGSPAEQAAERAAEAVSAGRQVPDVGAAGAGTLQLKSVTTAGGEWFTTTYSPIGQGATRGDQVGADIDLWFKPTDPVIADNIGITQTVTSLRSTPTRDRVDQPAFVDERHKGLTLGPGSHDPGRAVDQGKSTQQSDPTLPNTNPLYAVENMPGAVSKTLGDIPAYAPLGSHASRRRQPGGKVTTTAGHIEDSPRSYVEFPSQEWEQTFEATALVIDGPLANMYLGSIGWGWRRNARGAVELFPNPIRVVREGPPSAAFMEAAKVWNAATFTDPLTNIAFPTVDLPIEAVDPAALASADLSARLAAARAAAAAEAGPARDRKELEARGLERELRKRRLNIAVHVKSTEDWLGADHVYVQLSGGITHRTPTRELDDGQRHNFVVALSALPSLPVMAPVRVRAYDDDCIDGDDLIVDMTWNPGVARAVNSRSKDGASYEVVVTYDR